MNQKPTLIGTDVLTPVHSDQMPMFIGTKLVRAKPMTKDDFERLKGAAGQQQQVTGVHIDGYLVEYPDSAANIEGFAGYVSWSPKRQFEDAYRQTSGMTFGLAIDAMKLGYRVARSGWHKDQWLFIAVTSEQGGELWVMIRCTDGTTNPWVAYDQAEMLADDWAVVGMPAAQSAPGLQPHQQRVVDEKQALDARRMALGKFMNGERFHVVCDEAERIRMIRQYNAMELYSDVLGERIAAWGPAA